jgi:predicted metal-dependent hydrolase
MKPHIEEVVFGSTVIPFSIERSSNRGTVAVTVHPDLEVTVVAPRGMRRLAIKEAVAGKAEWVLRQWERFRQRHNSFEKQFVSGESFFYLGRQFKLKVIRARGKEVRSSVRLIKGQIRVVLSMSVEPNQQADHVRTLLVQWYRQRALERLPKIVGRYSEALGVGVSHVQVRDMKKRWGSGGPNGAMKFNWRIVMAPSRLIEYVVAHELCHLKHNDHSKDFWRLLERVMPNYERRRIELAFHGPKFDLRKCE